MQSKEFRIVLLSYEQSWPSFFTYQEKDTLSTSVKMYIRITSYTKNIEDDEFVKIRVSNT